MYMYVHVCVCMCVWEGGCCLDIHCPDQAVVYVGLSCTILTPLYVADLTDQSSFERAKFWVNELKQTEEV